MVVMMIKIQGILVLVLVAMMAVLLASCVSVGDNDSKDLPWSAPAGWENSTLGVPM